MGRIGYFLVQDNPGAVDAELLARSKLAQALMYFARGTPVIYYGDEQGFVGDGGDKLARQDMFPSLVPEYNDDDLIGTDATTADDNFDATHPIYQALADYAGVRQANAGAALRGADPPLQQQRARHLCLLAGSAETRRSSTWWRSTTPRQPARPLRRRFIGAGVQFDLVFAEGGSAAASLTTDANGDLALDVPALGFVIYKASAAIPASTAAPSISISNLQNNQEVTLQVQDRDGHAVTDRIEVVAELERSDVRRGDLCSEGERWRVHPHRHRQQPALPRLLRCHRAAARRDPGLQGHRRRPVRQPERQPRWKGSSR